MKFLYIFSILFLPLSLFSQNFPSFQKVKSDLITNKVIEKSDIGYLEQTEYPWELGIVKLFDRKTQDSVIPDYFNKASRVLKYNLPPRFSMSECSITIIYAKTKPNERWKYYTTVSDGCPKGSIETYNLLTQVSKTNQNMKTSFISSFIQKPSDWAEIVNLVGIDSNSIEIIETYGKEKLSFSILYQLNYSQNGKYSRKTYICSSLLINNLFAPKGDITQKNEQTLNELPASMKRIKP